MDIHYVAGLFDGEGYVRVNKWIKPNSTHIRYNLFVGLNMTYRPVIEMLHAQFGGGLHSSRKDLRNPKQRVLFCWMVASQCAATFLRAIQPHVIVKKDQVDLALEFQAHIDNNPYTPHGRPGKIHGLLFRENRDELLAFREECFCRIRDMKKERFQPLPSRPLGRPPGRKEALTA